MKETVLLERDENTLGMEDLMENLLKEVSDLMGTDGGSLVELKEPKLGQKSLFSRSRMLEIMRDAVTRLTKTLVTQVGQITKESVIEIMKTLDDNQSN